MRRFTAVHVGVGLAFLAFTAVGAACGRGPFLERPTIKDPMLRVGGRVVSRDGSTSGLGGIDVRWAELGASQTTAADGSFSFTQGGGTEAHLLFTDPLVATPATAAPAEGAGDCAAPSDGEDIAGNEVTLGGVDGSEDVNVEVDLAGGVVTGLRVTRALRTGLTAKAGAVELVAVDGSQASGVAVLRETDGALVLEIEATGLAPAAPYEVVLSDPSGAANVVPFVTDACGDGRLEVPFGSGAPSPVGWTAILRAAGGADVLMGTVGPAGTEVVGGDESSSAGED